ncbi:hypothetical protein GL263_25790, partial [Streptomyces durbertensis]
MTDPQSAADPLDHPDPLLAADALAAESLLRAYVRETGTDVPATGEQLVLTMPASGVRLGVPVRHRSATGWHRFGPARLLGADGGATPADVALVAAAAIRETTVGRGVPPQLGADAVGRVLNSAQRTAAHLTARRAEGEAATGPTPFLDSEQALLLGHPFHPAPKSREEASAHELDAYSPELRGSFAPHWFAVHRDELVGECADGDLETDVLRPLAEAAGLTGRHLPNDTVA